MSDPTGLKSGAAAGRSSCGCWGRTRPQGGRTRGASFLSLSCAKPSGRWRCAPRTKKWRTRCWTCWPRSGRVATPSPSRTSRYCRLSRYTLYYTTSALPHAQMSRYALYNTHRTRVARRAGRGRDEWRHRRLRGRASTANCPAMRFTTRPALYYIPNSPAMRFTARPAGRASRALFFYSRYRSWKVREPQV